MVPGIPINIHLEGYNNEQTTLNTRDEIPSAMNVCGFLNHHDKTLTISNK